MTVCVLHVSLTSLKTVGLLPLSDCQHLKLAQMWGLGGLDQAFGLGWNVIVCGKEVAVVC